MAVGATPAETKAFTSAVQLLDTKLYSLAESRFAKFLEQFPETTLRPDAILHEAQASFFQSNHVGTLELLQKNLPQAGSLADEYQFWIGQTFLQTGKNREAADAFAGFSKTFPASKRLLEANFQEAFAESKIGNWPRVVDLLHAPGNKFEIAAKTEPTSIFVVEANLLLTDALIRQNRFAEAELVAGKLEGKTLAGEAKWRRSFLLCQVQMGENQPAKALETSTNLLAAAKEIGRPRALAESFTLQGDILEKLNRFPESIQAHEQNLLAGSSSNVPPEIRRASFFKIVELSLLQKDTANAVRRLENFLDQNPSDATVDLARLTLAELRLKQYVASLAEVKSAAGEPAVLFAQALTNLNTVITNFPQSPHLGKAYLNRGWCYWLQEKFPLAEADFLEATKRLPPSEDQAVARFKLADTQLKQTNYAAAATNYQLLVGQNSGFARVTNSLFEPALFQTVRAGLQMGKDEVATNAMQKLLDRFPTGSLSDRSVLLVGQTFTQLGKPAEARQLFLDFLKRVPGSSRLADVKLAIAQTYVQENDWSAALLEYGGWVTNFVQHPRFAEGLYSFGLVYEKAGQETNAFGVFTNFLSRYPLHPLAPQVQNWIADFYWNREDFRNAEKNYQELYQKYKSDTGLAYEARLMAGRAAFHRSDFPEAAKYFKALIESLDKDTNAAPVLKGEAWFALGDTLFQNFLANTNRLAEDFREAITALTRVTKDFPDTTLYDRAWGRMGDYYFQWAEQDVSQADTRYQAALGGYGVVTHSTVSDVSARSQAAVGVGNVCVRIAALKSGSEKKLWLDAGLKNYMSVVFESNLGKDEFSDSKWVYEAGIKAAKVCESAQQWEQAEKIYQRLAERLPHLQSSIQKRIDSISPKASRSN